MNLYRLCVIAVVKKGLPYDDRRLPATAAHDLRMCERFADAALFNDIPGGDPLCGAGPSATFALILRHGSLNPRGAAALSWAYDFFGRLVVFPDSAETPLCVASNRSWLIGAGKFRAVLEAFTHASGAHANCRSSAHVGFGPMTLFAELCGFAVWPPRTATNLGAAKDLWRVVGTTFASWPCYRRRCFNRDLFRPFTDYRDAFLPLEPELHDAVLALRDLWDIENPDHDGDFKLKAFPSGRVAIPASALPA